MRVTNAHGADATLLLPRLPGLIGSFLFCRPMPDGMGYFLRAAAAAMAWATALSHGIADRPQPRERRPDNSPRCTPWETGCQTPRTSPGRGERTRCRDHVLPPLPGPALRFRPHVPWLTAWAVFYAPLLLRLVFCEACG